MITKSINKFFFVIATPFLLAACKSNTNAIISGVPWYTQNGENVSAHGANIIKEGDTFYLFGEYKNTFISFQEALIF
ncbi:hypothetical protein PK35_14335 [Tamlana nanhaiensis]|uniref:Uncharacterized protein n=1 Tax=Neotamlana nanhaiensis TaxID=1382798 RepID=A0A0D7W142_9FLAO|nr:hypothetical protein [Tamlana nanhaiensis]KJD31577.1 hypothetical protein PK35_14335 [Tamlana nanhaiensis]